VLEIVAAQTGYPTDLLDMDLDLEADLGIDTVKQAEVFARIRECYGIERDDELKLRDYPTLNHVVGFVLDRMPAPAEAEAESPAAPAEPESPAADAPEPASPIAADAEGFPRRVPVPVPRPPLDLCLPTGVTIDAGSRIVVMPDEGGVVDVLGAKLAEAGADVLTLKRTATVTAVETQVATWTESAPIDGVFWLPGLDLEQPVTKLSPAARRDALHVRVKLLAAAMRALPEPTFLVSATRLGGRHGYDEAGSLGVLGGAVTGFTKALGRERGDTVIKAVDFGTEDQADAAVVAQTLLDETARDPGAVEIGYADDLRWTVALVEREAEHDVGREFDQDTVFLVTGAAGSIVSAIVTDLAAASGGTFHLVDLVAEPDRDDADLARFASDRDGLARELADRIRERGERPTPKLVERDLARIERGRAALDAIEAIERAGGSAHWHQVDLTDAKAVGTAVKGALKESGKVDVVLHAAGLEISHFLPDKPQAEYDLVFDVKAHGWLNLLAGFGAQQPSAAIVFSSIAGRFGNGGQTDYSAANDLLCKSASHMRRGDTRGVAIDWTAWASIGMASRGSIPKMMEVAGIDMLPADVGVPVVRRELTAAGTGGEVLEAGALGVLEAERHPSGGLDPERATAACAEESGPMTGRIESFTAHGQVTVVTELDPNRQPFLFDHRIDGTPVLPGVMGMEGFAEVAAALVPGFRVVELTDVDLLAPFKFYRDEPRPVILRATLTDGGDGTLLADCELIGRRELRGQDEQETRHFVGRARLARKAPAAPKARSRPADHDGAGVGHDAVYGVYFHGPAYQVLEQAWRDNGQLVGRFAGELPANHEPASQTTEIAPRLIELCFQTAGMWELASEGRMALPTHVDRVVRYASAKKPSRLWAVVTPREGGGADAEIIDEGGRVRVKLEGYRTIALPGELPADALAPIQSGLSTA
jgi:NAD(P)-dependent dehydrogenase (short-subunit alcohol dehydrogenase family)